MRVVAIAGSVVLLALTGLLAWYLLATPGGAVRTIEFGVGRVPGQLEVTDITGSLWGGVSAGVVSYRENDLSVVATDVRLDVDLRQLVSGRLVIEHAAAESIVVDELPVDLRVRLNGTARLTHGLPFIVQAQWADRVSAVTGGGQFSGTLDSIDFAQVVELPETVHVDGTLIALLDAPAVSAVARWRKLTLPWQDFGALVSRDGEAAITATPDSYDVAATTALIRDERQQLSMTLRAHGDAEQLVIDNLALDGLGGELTASGSVGFGEPSAIALEVAGRDFDPGVLLPGYDGRLTFIAGIDARWPERLSVDVSQLDGEFLGPPITGTGELLAVNGMLQRAHADLRSGLNELRLVAHGQPRLAGEFEIDAPDLAALWPGLAGGLRGSGTLSGTREAPRISADLEGEALRLGGQSIDNVRVVGRADVDSGVAFEARANGVTVGGQFLGNVSARGSGTIEAHALDIEIEGGVVETHFEADGSWDGETLDEQIRVATVNSQIGAWQLREPLSVTTDGRGATISAHCWDNAPASICTDGVEIREDRLTAGAVLSSFPLQVLDPWLGGDITLAGQADARLAIDRDADGFEAMLDWKQDDTRIVFQGAVEDMLAESEVETRLSSVRFRLTANERFAELSGSVIGAFGLAAEVDARLEAPLTPDGMLSGLVRAEVPTISELRPLVDRYVSTERLDGALIVDIRLGGTRSVPTLDGSARLQEGTAAIPLFGITVEDIDLTVRAGADDNLVIEGSARSGDGVIELTGVIGLSQDAGLYADVTVTGDRFQLIKLPDQAVFVSPDLTARFDGGRIELNGRVLVPEAAFEFRELDESATARSEDVVVHREGAEPDEVVSSSRITGQLDIELGDAVTFTGLGLSTRLTGGLLLTMRPGAPVAGEGSFQLVDGVYDAFGRQMVVERGSLNFFGPLDDPVINARATRRFRYETQDIKLGVNLTGRLSQRLEFALFSEPAMSEADILSYMVVGRPTSNDGNQSDGAVSGAALAMGLQSLSATSRVGDTLTLDEISFEGGGADDTSVVAGKRLSERWYIRYTYGLFNRVGTFIIRYEIGRGVSVEAGSGAQQSLDLIYSIDR